MTTTAIALQAFLEAGFLASAILVCLGGAPLLVPRRAKRAINRAFHRMGF